jgi:hypothetical protein
MYYFTDTWYGNVYEFRTLREAKREAKQMTCGHSIAIFRNGEIVSTVKPREKPFP